MRKLSEAAQVAAQIRAGLKQLGIAAKVRSENYAGGNSVNIDLTDEPPHVRALLTERYAKYQYGKFDGMTDSYDHCNVRKDIPQVRFLFVNNSCSKQLRRKIFDHLRTHYAGGECLPENYEIARNERIFGEYVSTMVHRLFSGWGDFWGQSPMQRAT